MRQVRQWNAAVVALAGIAMTPGDAAGSNAVPFPDQKDKAEWIDIDLPTLDRAGPRVLVIGDSISRAYYPDVARRLTPCATVARLATSLSVTDPRLLQQVRIVLGTYRFDVIHFNNGLHGWEYHDARFARAYPAFVQSLRRLAPDARIILATTTPVRLAPDMRRLSPDNDRVRARNVAVVATAHATGLPIDDLYQLALQHPDYHVGGDGTHFGPDGVAAEARQVARAVAGLLSPDQAKSCAIE